MKKLLLFATLFLAAGISAQGASISWKKKIIDPVVINQDTIKIKDEIKLQLGSNIDGSFKFVQLLNGMNEPIKSADSRASMMKQEIKFFKSADDVYYAFTKFFAVNLEAALLSKEIILIKK